MLAGRVTVEPAMRVVHDALHDSRVEHAELRGKSLHNMVNRKRVRHGRRASLTSAARPGWPGQSRIR